jgi:serine phosphatase RsbU (regulator of sigma subunit)
VAGAEWIDELFERVEEVLGVDTISLLLVDSSGEHLVAHATHGLEEEVRQGFRLNIGAGFSGRIAQTGRPASVESIDPTMVANPLVIRKGIRSMMGVPLTSAARTIGVLHVGSRVQRAFTDVDMGFLQLVADRMADELVAEQERHDVWAATMLQRSLLPAKLPAIEGLEFAERFVPGGHAVLGGDWYDAFALPSGRIGVVIGDVAGHGLRAAVVMGRLRSVLRSYAFIGRDPATTLDQVDAKFTFFEPGEMATILFAVIEPEHDAFTVATAGHPPPLLALDGEPARFVEVPPAPPVGARVGGRRRSLEVPLPLGATLMMFTDGLFERRTEPFRASLERLRCSLRSGPVDDAINGVMEEMIGTSIVDDDTAVLAVRRTGPPADAG